MRVIIADDEIHVRRRLAEKIDWAGYGVKDVVLCSDGDEIIEAMKEKGGDLIITDIRMARVDGIEAVREVRKQFPRVPVIMMSAYDDKEYLKSALDLQVRGYLEKPFTLEQVQEAVKRVIDFINEKKQTANAVGYAAKAQRRQMLEEAALGLCQYRDSYEESISCLEEEYPEFAHAACHYTILLRRREEDLDYSPDGDVKWCTRLLEEQKWCGICAGTKRGWIILLLAAGTWELEKMLDRLLHRSGSTAEAKQASRWMIAVGSPADSLPRIYRSYQDAVLTMERHFYHRSPILSFQEMQLEPVSFSPQEQEGFQFSLKSRNTAACISYLEGLRRTLKQHDTTLVRVTKNHYFQLALLILQNRVQEKKAEVSEFYLWELFYQRNSLDELHDFLLELLQDCMPHSAQSRQEDDITDVLNYIQENLNNPALSLADISRAYYMSVTYLCMYFKEKTGTTIKSYIIDCRMKKAAQLLTYTDLKVAEVAEAVGFTDQSYFTKSFGRFFGKSPSRFKEEEGTHGEEA
ncbi:MAG: response regulator [Lachnospiraceae bacterium]|nr:response regulator [Lachnospiraceae bacterium]